MEHLLKVRKNSIFEEPVQRIIIGVAGGSAAGKTTLCENINRQMAFDRNFKVEILSLDSFYKSLEKNVDPRDYNFDHPNALDFDLAYETLKQMKQSNQKVPIPQYSFINHNRLPDPVYANPANIILFEGLMAFHDPRIRDLMTYKVFITCDDDIRLCRRLKRDTRDRGRSIVTVLQQYSKFVKDSFTTFVQPTMIYADIIIPGFRNNRVSVDFIVQHIKNIARRINYRETATRTKIYIFGENELYDFEYQDSEQNQLALFQESFLVFPTSEQHKRELQFFMNRLISQTFAYEYYEQIYICQFIKIQKSLLNQLIELKGYSTKNIEIFPEHLIEDLEKFNLFEKNIKVIFFPIAYSPRANQIISLISRQKIKQPDSIHIIITIFCEINFPRIIYKLCLPNVILVNLFVIANDQRFRDAMKNNIMKSQRKQNWLENDEILTNQGAFIIGRDLKLFYLLQFELQMKKYNIAVQSLKKPLKKRKVDESQETFRLFNQKNVYCQEHENLCGYHALVNIILRSKNEQLTSKQKFVKYYNILSKQAKNKDFQPLERNVLDSLLKHNYFKGLSIQVLYYGSGYIQNSFESLRQLQRSFNLFMNYTIEEFYLLMGIFDHFFLLQFRRYNKDIQINLYDSCNISLTDILSLNYDRFKKQHQQSDFDQEAFESYKKHLKNAKEALDIIQTAVDQKKKFIQILVEKRIEEFAIPFFQLKNQKEILNYFKNEQPVSVIVNDLIGPIKQVQIDRLSEKHKKLLNDFLMHPEIKSRGIAISK